MRTIDELITDAAPFPDGMIKQTPAGAKRPALDYVAWTDYAQRLLATHGGHRYEITQMVYGGDQWSVAVRVYLDMDEWYDGAGTDVSADKAESQAYKRACAHAGIGLHLWHKGTFWLPTSLEKHKEDDNG